MKEPRAVPTPQSASPYSAAQWNSFREALETLRREDTTGDPQYSKKFLLWLDEPVDWKQRARRCRFSGWCIAQNGRPLPAIRASIRGQTFETLLDRDRPDVVEGFRLPKAVERCGFVLDLTVPRGKSRVELQGEGPDGGHFSGTRSPVRGRATHPMNPSRPRKSSISLPIIQSARVSNSGWTAPMTGPGRSAISASQAGVWP